MLLQLHTLSKGLASIYEIEGVAGRNRLLPMEGVRGLAVVLVFFVHYESQFEVWVSREPFSLAFSNFMGSIGHSGVDLFFVLSGYLIYGLIFKKPRQVVQFIKRRIQRIYPTFLAVLAVYLVLSVLFPAENKIPVGAGKATYYIIENLLLLPGLFNIQPLITVSWSLSYEFFYYLLIPVVVGLLFMRRWRASARIIFFLAVASLYSAHCLVALHSHIRLIMFISGILLFEATYSYGLEKKMKPQHDYVILFLLALTFPVYYILTQNSGAISFLPHKGSLLWICSTGLLFISFFFLTLACFGSPSLLSRIFSWTPLRWLGNMSYSYYLIHALTLKGIALVLVRRIPTSNASIAAYWIGLPTFFFLTLISSTLLFILIEKRFSMSGVSGRPRDLRSDQIAFQLDPNAPPAEASRPPLNAARAIPQSK